MGKLMGVSATITVNLARQLVEDYGREAEEAARERAEALKTYGNYEAAAVWSLVHEILCRQRKRYRSDRRIGARDILSVDLRKSLAPLFGNSALDRRR
jgi:hypothetical protein